MASMDSSMPSESRGSELLRRGLLHPIGVSFLVIVEKACTRSQQLDGPIGSVNRKMGRSLKPVLPFIYGLQYQWLILLSFLDDHIKLGANMFTTIFPSSTRLFHMIDSLIDAIETLPTTFDNGMNKFPRILRRSPFLHRVFTTCIAWIDFLISRTILSRTSSDTWEKEITVDTNCENKNNNEIPNNEEYLERSVVMKSNDDGCCTTGMTNMKCSYKDVLLDKGKKESGDEKKEDYCFLEENPEAYFSTDEAEEKEGSNESFTSEDPILELFETSWHQTKGTSLPTSYSFT